MYTSGFSWASFSRARTVEDPGHWARALQNGARGVSLQQAQGLCTALRTGNQLFLRRFMAAGGVEG